MAPTSASLDATPTASSLVDERAISRWRPVAGGIAQTGRKKAARQARHRDHRDVESRLERFLERQGIEMVRTPGRRRYVLERMLTEATISPPAASPPATSSCPTSATTV